MLRIGLKLAKELLAMLSIAKGFGAARARRRQRSCSITAGEACLQVRTAHVLMQESGVEAVARTDRVYCYNFFGSTDETLAATLGHRSLRSDFHHHERNLPRQSLYRSF